jgi:drug/metabolite transporter (DMT)-like permease
MNPIVRWGLVLLVVAGLVVDAWTHFDVAHLYTFNRTSTVNEGVLFRVEAVIALVSAALILARPNALTATFAALVAGGGAALLVLYRYVDVGKLGPLPNMHEPIWYDEKVVSLIGELVAFVAAAALLAGIALTRRAAPTRVTA